MHSAFDIVLGRAVRASHAHHDPHRYICRACQKHVFFASGDQRTYFSHYSREDENDSCAFRVAELEQSPKPLSEGDFDESNAELACEWRIERTGIKLRYFLLYRPRADVERVIFNQAGNSASYQVRSEMFLSIDQQCSDYYFEEWINSAKDHVQIVSGFSSPVVFRCSENRGIRLPRHRSLRTGSDYVAVFATQPSPFPAVFSPENINSDLNLFAVRFSIPKQLTPNELSFLRRTLNQHVNIATVDYAIVRPLIVEELQPDCWATAEASCWSVRMFCDPTLYPTPVRLLVRRRSVHGESEYEELQIEASNGVFDIELELAPPSVSLINVGLGTRTRAEFVFELRHVPCLIAPSSGILTFTVSANSEQHSYSWSSHRLPKVLKSVVSGQVLLLSATIPKGVNPKAVVDGKTAPIKASCYELRQALKNGKAVTLVAEGYPDIIIKGSKASKRHAAELNPFRSIRVNGTPAMQDAFRRGVVSNYAANSRRDA